MTISIPHKSSGTGNRRKMRGFSLVEALIAMLLFAVGFLAIAGIQLRGMQASRISLQRSTAIRLAEDLADKILANRLVLTNDKDFYSRPPSNPPDCYDSSVVCNAEQLGRRIQQQWQNNVQNSLLNPTTLVCFHNDITNISPIIINAGCDPNGTILVIKIQWQELGQQNIGEAAQLNTSMVFLPVLNLI